METGEEEMRNRQIWICYAIMVVAANIGMFCAYREGKHSADRWYAGHDIHPLKSQETLSEVAPAGIGKPQAPEPIVRKK